MPVKNRFSELLSEITKWRRDIHENPELLFDTHRTSSFVEERLKEFGCDDVITGIGRTGVIGVIKGQTNKSGKVIGLRADMDALPIFEATGLIIFFTFNQDGFDISSDRYQNLLNFSTNQIIFENFEDHASLFMSESLIIMALNSHIIPIKKFQIPAYLFFFLIFMNL